MSNTPKAALFKENRPYDLDAAIAEVDRKPFTFRFAGREWQMPHLDSLNLWDLVTAADGGDMAATLKMFEVGLGDDWAAFRAIPLPRAGMTALIEGYMKHSGVAPGELLASAS